MKRAFAICVLLVACGDDGLQHGIDAAVDAPPPFATAPHTPLPQAIPHAGVMLDHPKLVTITYADYAFKPNVEAWGDAVATSSWWTTVGAEYGVGAMTHDSKLTLGNAPTTTLEDTDIEAQLQASITNHSLPTPPATGNEYLYMIYIPSTVPLGASLKDLYGYHAMLTRPNGVNFAYAVIVDDGSGIDTTTSTAAHELIEAATNPYLPPSDGWYVDPPLPDPWYLALEEVGDLCSFEPVEHEGAFGYQRVWSNAAAAAGENPCIPSHDEPWQTVSAAPETMPSIARGTAATFELTGWSTQEVPDWTLDYGDADYSELTSTQIAPRFSSMTINNRQTVTLTLHAPASAAVGRLGGIYVLSGEHARPWVVGFIVK